MSLRPLSPPAYQDWSNAIYNFTKNAGGALALYQAGTLEMILTRLIYAFEESRKMESLQPGAWPRKGFIDCGQFTRSPQGPPLRHNNANPHICRSVGQLRPLSTSWCARPTDFPRSMLYQLTPRKTQVGNKPVLNGKKCHQWLDPGRHALSSFRLPSVFPLPGFDSEETTERSLARLGLRAQRRYGIPAAEWSRRWGM